jgi:hypothetical protein
VGVEQDLSLFRDSVKMVREARFFGGFEVVAHLATDLPFPPR